MHENRALRIPCVAEDGVEVKGDDWGGRCKQGVITNLVSLYDGPGGIIGLGNHDGKRTRCEEMRASRDG